MQLKFDVVARMPGWLDDDVRRCVYIYGSAPICVPTCMYVYKGIYECNFALMFHVLSYYMCIMLHVIQNIAKKKVKYKQFYDVPGILECLKGFVCYYDGQV